MGKSPEDVDLVTTATFDQIKDLFEKENIIILSDKGKKHGTILCRINKKNYDISTLR